MLGSGPQSSFESSLLLVAGRDEAPPGGVELGDLCPNLRLQAGVGRGQSRRGADRLNQRRVVEQRRVVNDHGERSSVALDDGGGSMVTVGRAPRDVRPSESTKSAVCGDQ